MGQTAFGGGHAILEYPHHPAAEARNDVGTPGVLDGHLRLSGLVEPGGHLTLDDQLPLLLRNTRQLLFELCLHFRTGCGQLVRRLTHRRPVQHHVVAPLVVDHGELFGIGVEQHRVGGPVDILHQDLAILDRVQGLCAGLSLGLET